MIPIIMMANIAAFSVAPMATKKRVRTVGEAFRNTECQALQCGQLYYSRIPPKINPSAGRILKYFPDALLTPEQQTSAAIARLQEEIYILEKT
ncbi:MAG: hypothetical protein IJ041_06015 [Clostridia bacterium]|nr:hypothetical protein [Clostridia bacterium]